MKIVDGLKLAALTLATPSDDGWVDFNMMMTSFTAAGVSLCMGLHGAAGVFALTGFWDFLKEGSYAVSCLRGEKDDSDLKWRGQPTPFNVVRELIQDNATTIIDKVSVQEMKPYVRLIGRHLRSDHYAPAATHLLSCIAAEDVRAIDPAVPDMVGFLRYGDTSCKRTKGEKLDQKMDLTRQDIIWILQKRAKQDPKFFAKIERDLRKAIDRTACPFVFKFYTSVKKPETASDVKWLVGWLDNRQTQADAAWALRDALGAQPDLVKPYRALIEAKTACFAEAGRPLALFQLRDAMEKAGRPQAVPV